MSYGNRIASIDWMRGLVMLLMLIDHASVFFNQGRLDSDGAGSYVAGTVLPTGQFIFRWITHLCAPTFVFLSGLSLAISIDSRLEKGQRGAGIDRDMALRGLIVFALDIGFVSVMVGYLFVQILYAIGVSMMLMVLFRRLSNRSLISLALGWFVFGELFTTIFWNASGDHSVLTGLLLAPYKGDHLTVAYPLVPWVSIMLLGYAVGRQFLSDLIEPKRLIPKFMGWGILALLVFFVIRLWGGYGNMSLNADDWSVTQLLHVSKYPPSLSFYSLELGCMSILLAGFLWVESRTKYIDNGVLAVFGQTALFFYILHITLLMVLRMAGIPKGGIDTALLVAILVGIVSYPLCYFYRKAKRRHPTSILKFI